MISRNNTRTSLLIALILATCIGPAHSANITNAKLSGSSVSTLIVPDPQELNQMAKVYIAAQYGGKWYARATGLHDWQPLTTQTLPVSQQALLTSATSIEVTDVNLAAYPGLTLYVGYSTANGTLTTPGHMRLIYQVAPAMTQDNGAVGLLPPVSNGNGAAATFTLAGAIDTSNPFFKAQGNGRSCATCHDQNAGWSITPDTLAQRFTASSGLDPVFRLVDGANSPNAAVSTTDQRFAAYSMLRTKGLIRVGLPLPSGAEFSLSAVDDPYGYASAQELSLFRRPLPTTNLQFTTAVMWDGRETIAAAGGNLCVKEKAPGRCFAPVNDSLSQQANDAVKGHAQFAAGLSLADGAQIVDFERTLFTTQVMDNAAGSLSDGGATSGPVALANIPFYFGMNDPAKGDYHTGADFNRRAMKLFSAWLKDDDKHGATAATKAQQEARESIARGEQLFNTKHFVITDVRGFNDELGTVRVHGSCTSCHSTPNSGTHSIPRFMDTGVASAARRTADLPLYTFRNSSTGELFATTDPGRGLITGKWADLGKMKVPSLRAIESRSPYFHNGSEDDIEQLIRFYDKRFNIQFTDKEIRDLGAFLKAL